MNPMSSLKGRNPNQESCIRTRISERISTFDLKTTCDVSLLTFSTMQYLEVQSRKEFDPETNKKFKACGQNRYPICLQEALIEKYGHGWKKKTVVEDDRILVSLEFASPKRVWKLYVRNVSEWEKNLGREMTREIEMKALKKMESMQCRECPMYEFELERLRERRGS